jgi:hypothetical protein
MLTRKILNKFCRYPNYTQEFFSMRLMREAEDMLTRAKTQVEIIG